MANSRRGAARTSKAKKSEPALDGRYLWTRLVWLGLAVGWLLTATALISFDIGDAPSHAVWPRNAPTQNWIGVVGAHTAYAILKLVGLGAIPAMIAWLMALVWSAAGREFRHPFVRTAGIVLIVASIASLSQVLLGDAGPMPGLAGGIVGVSAGRELLVHTGSVGSVLILLAAMAAGLILTFDRLVFVAAGWIASLFMTSAQRAQAAAKKRAEQKRKQAARVRQTDLENAEIEIKQGKRGRKPMRERISELAGGLGGGERFDPDLAVVDPDDVEEEWDDEVDEDSEDEEYDEEWDEEEEDGEEEEWEEEDEEDAAEVVASDDDEDEEDELPGAPQIFDRDKLKEKISALPVRFASAEKGSATQADLDAYQQNAVAMEGYKFPTLELLEEPDEGFNEKLEEMVREQAEALEEALQEYKLRGEVVGIESGPVITLYHVKLAAGTKVAALNAIASDLARALKSVNIRIVPNMAGRDTVGIEVPNLTKEKVRLKELMRNRALFEKMKLPMFLGKDASGDPLIADLAKMPHVLIAGTTGSGKSVCMNTIVMSFLYTKKPNELKLVLVDPKMVEMSQFKDIPHLMCPVVTEMSKAAAILEWAVGKMDERYELLAEAGCRDISSYNELDEEELIDRFTPVGPNGREELNEQEKARIPRKLPYMVFIIDELADLMMTNKEVEGSIVRIAQKARAVGIHLILATQRPQANVVTGLIKGNMPCRISFKVASGLDSRIVLDQKGGELLLGMGDMLFLSPSSHKLSRSQGTLVDDKEIRRVTKFLKDVAGPSFERSLVQLRSGGISASDEERLQATENNSSASLKAAQEDPLFDRAVEIVLETKRGSVSLLQRRLAIGYTRASRLIDLMGIAGIIGEHKGSVAREVLISPEEWSAIKQLAEEMAAQQGVEYPRHDSASQGDGEDDPDQQGLFEGDAPESEAVESDGAESEDPESQPAGGNAFDEVEDADTDDEEEEDDDEEGDEEETDGDDEELDEDEEWEWVEEEVEEDAEETDAEVDEEEDADGVEEPPFNPSRAGR
jgi:S-DNA-T family DNA segregation ATPase FtsK/SpoIIIE